MNLGKRKIMDNYKHLILIKGEPKDSIVSCYYDKSQKKQAVVFENNPTVYHYHYDNVKWLESIGEVDDSEYKFFTPNGILLDNIVKIIEFGDSYNKYFRFFFSNNTFRSYNVRDLNIKKNAAVSPKIKGLIEYYSKVAEINGLIADDGSNMLKTKYEKLDFISNDTVLAKYLDSGLSLKLNDDNDVIFPFGCNLSQITAVRNAITNQISVIEGPPGTGKTQTILNIIANIVMRDMSVAVVSNNNSATENIFEKLQKYKYSYIAAQLGSSQNKEDFIENKQQKYPDFSGDKLEYYERSELLKCIADCENNLVNLFKNQNRIAELKSYLSSLNLEKKYFDDYFESAFSEKNIFKRKNNLTSEKMLLLWNDLQSFIDKNKPASFWYKLKSVVFYGISGFKVYNYSLTEIIAHLKKFFYEFKIAETESEIRNIEQQLAKNNASELLSELTNKSTQIFRSILADKYCKQQDRPVFKEEVFWENSRAFLKEYPVILSTTFSVKSSLNNIIYDYVIVDESSQVDITTGILAMSCAKNIVVVGDLKQLPNVISEADKKLITQISDSCKISDNFRCEKNSLLSSVCETFTDAPRTLLREHYRCHPKIIEFCNQKFYNNQLIIMTHDNGEADVLKAYITNEGNHARGHFNQRQIDEIKSNILPELNSDDVGIIAPYRAQTEALSSEIDVDVDISTVHKFQGREKDDIIISTVDNQITEFTDDPNMLNVAVSRAKKRLRVVISNNEENEKTNIGDLIKYIRYNNFEIKQSDIYSVFDMLYKCYEEKRKKYLTNKKRISEYDSENIMCALIGEVLNMSKFSKFDFISHQSLSTLIRDPYKLTDREMEYAMNPLTHLDFLIFNAIDKAPVLAIEVDGYAFHNANAKQSERDQLKDIIFRKIQYSFNQIQHNGKHGKRKA